jgi:hypothetical protein
MSIESRDVFLYLSPNLSRYLLSSSLHSSALILFLSSLSTVSALRPLISYTSLTTPILTLSISSSYLPLLLLYSPCLSPLLTFPYYSFTHPVYLLFLPSLTTPLLTLSIPSSHFHFKIDDEYNAWLIEINSSPACDYSTSVTTR